MNLVWLSFLFILLIYFPYSPRSRGESSWRVVWETWTRMWQEDASSTSLNHRGSKHLSRPLLRTQNSPPDRITLHSYESDPLSHRRCLLFVWYSINFFFFFACVPSFPMYFFFFPSIAVLVRNGKEELENRSNSVQKLAQVVLERPTRNAALPYIYI